MIIEIQDESIVRNDPSDYAESFFAAAATSGNCIGNCCCSSSHQTQPPAQ